MGWLNFFGLTAGWYPIVFVCVWDNVQNMTDQMQNHLNRCSLRAALECSAQQIHAKKRKLYLYIYLYGDRSEGPCKEFKLRRPFMFCWEPSQFVSSRKKLFYSRKFRESLILWIIITVYITACSGLPPPAARGSGRRMVPHICFPFIGTSLHLPLVLPNVAFWSLKKQAPNAAAKLPKVRLCEGQTPRPLVLAFPLMSPLLMSGVCR